MGEAERATTDVQSVKLHDEERNKRENSTKQQSKEREYLHTSERCNTDLALEYALESRGRFTHYCKGAASEAVAATMMLSEERGGQRMFLSQGGT
jgi:hypothetical protein